MADGGLNQLLANHLHGSNT